MTLLLLLYATIAVYGIRKRTDLEAYFGVDDTNVLRGLWCIVVILVHVPAGHQNKIQDMIGSFAYIGVTFFFMTSAFGLKYGMTHKENYLRGFWVRRLSQLLVPAVLINVVSVLNNTLLSGDEFNIFAFAHIDSWVKVLLLFYFAFWIANSINFSKLKRGGLVKLHSMSCGYCI